MRKFLLLLLGAILLSLLAFFCFQNKASFIKNDLESKAKRLYDDENMSWVDAKLRGEDKTLTTILSLKGTAPSKEEKLKAAKLAKNIDGISYIDNQITVLEDKEDKNETIATPTKELSNTDKNLTANLQEKDTDEDITEKEIAQLMENSSQLSADTDSETHADTLIKNVPKAKQTLDANSKTTNQNVASKNKTETRRRELNDMKTPKETHVLVSKAKEKSEKKHQKQIKKKKVKKDNIRYSKKECQSRFDNLLSKNKITFKYDSADITPQSFKILDELVLITKRCGKIAIMISGHTDSDGKESYNLKLSQKRANAVKRYMVKNGIKDKYLLAVGYGETKPIASNATKEGKEKNRRIEFSIEGKR